MKNVEHTVNRKKRGKKKWMALAMMFVLMVFAACDQPEDSASMEGAAGMEGSVEVSVAAAQPVGTDVEYTYAECEEMAVYYSNGKADGLEKEVLAVEAMTPEEVVKSLSRHNIVSIDTKVLGFGETDGQGRKLLALDLSKAFGEYVKTMGESGEKVVMAALTNTFLENYGADGLLLTVEGEILETRHGSYGEELTFWQPDTGASDR